MRSPVLCVFPILAAIAACSSVSTPSGEQPPQPGAPPATGGGGGGGVPCAVQSLVDKHCASCHSSPPRSGAPMPLVRREDWLAPSKSNPQRKVHELVSERTRSEKAPMPESGLLPPSTLAPLDAWLAAGLPASTEACGTPAPPAPVGPVALPCPPSEQITFQAHGEAKGSKFHVPQDAGNAYTCFSFKVPTAGVQHMTAFAPIIDDARVVHHYILYETTTPQTDGAFGPCDMPRDAAFVSGWAPGGVGGVLPPDVGMEIRQDRWFILQLHYYNVARLTDANDASGLSICVTPNLRTHTAVVSTLGSPAINLPPRSSDVRITNDCVPIVTEPLHIIGAAPHMHKLGTSIKTDILRGGDPAKIEPLVAVPRWSFDDQRSYAADKIINKGDVLRTECVYSNPTNATVKFGEKTDDEMCFDFVTVWPAPGLLNSVGQSLGRNICIGAK